MGLLATVLIAYGLLCIVSVTVKPEKLWNLVKGKFGKFSEKFVVAFVFVWGLAAVVGGILIFVL